MGEETKLDPFVSSQIMDWHSNLRTFVSRPDNSFNFLYDYRYDQFNNQGNTLLFTHFFFSFAWKVSAITRSYNFVSLLGIDVKQHPAMAETPQVMVPTAMDKLSFGIHDKKKRLTSDQLDSLERSFQEEIKLDPDRKMKLSRELGLQPRQIAVWFQNRRARWKAKQLERLYDALKQEFDVVSVEKQKLQEEVGAS